MSLAPATVEGPAAIARLADAKQRITSELGKVIVGQDEVVNLLMIALFSRGHALLVGVPGLAKTLLISSLAKVLSLSSNRIQFTPDLMPSDITGTDVIEEDRATGKREFRFVQGPIFTNLLLADEINRTPPKTQAALLQAMAEHRVTASGRTFSLPAPYFVLATQNPIEQEGTYPLPEAQRDRFLFQINVDYPSVEDEIEVVRRTTKGQSADLEQVLSKEELLALQEMIPTVPVAEHVLRYAVDLVRASRPESAAEGSFVRKMVAFGAGPRASQSLILAAKARAALGGRFAAEQQDVDAVARAVLVHRLVPSFRADAEGVTVETIVGNLLSGQPR